MDSDYKADKNENEKIINNKPQVARHRCFYIESLKALFYIC